MLKRNQFKNIPTMSGKLYQIENIICGKLSAIQEHKKGEKDNVGDKIQSNFLGK